MKATSLLRRFNSLITARQCNRLVRSKMTKISKRLFKMITTSALLSSTIRKRWIHISKTRMMTSPNIRASKTPPANSQCMT
jgi:hypothetical protein